MCEKMQLMRQLQAANFALIETVLFLDSHPGDSQALAYYQEQAAAYEELVAKYEQSYGPLTVYSPYYDGEKWTSEPWPWELEAN